MNTCNPHLTDGLFCFVLINMKFNVFGIITKKRVHWIFIYFDFSMSSIYYFWNCFIIYKKLFIYFFVLYLFVYINKKKKHNGGKLRTYLTPFTTHSVLQLMVISMYLDCSLRVWFCTSYEQEKPHWGVGICVVTFTNALIVLDNWLLVCYTHTLKPSSIYYLFSTRY